MLNTAADTLARAFVADPMFEWVFPDPAIRTQKLAVLNRIPLEFGLRYGLMVTQSDGARGVAIWLRPVQSRTPMGMLTAPFIVAVDPDLQGQGHGAALVREGLDRADRDGLPCYLDTSKAANVPFYEYLGFATVDRVPLGKGGPPGWGMRREPQPTGSG